MTRRLVPLLLFLCLIPAPVLAQAVVTLKEEAWVDTTAVFLGQVADFEGEPDTINALAQVDLGAAPIAGASRRLTLGQIEVRLRRAGFNPRNLEFSGAREVLVFRGKAVVTEVEAAADGYPVVVAARDIPRLHIITADDLEVRYEGVLGLQWNSGNMEEFIGKRTVRAFSGGAILTPAGVEVPPLIERGNPVTIISVTGSVQVSAPGVARASGGLGEVIPVENTTSRQIVYGEIIDSDTVLVLVGGQGQ